VESQARTRQLVLEAAERRFLSDGFSGTSLEDIARDAGFSKGAVYSNFAGKTDLFFAVLERQFVVLADQLREAVRAEPDAVSQFAAVNRWYEHFLQVESGWTRSLPEVVAITAQDEAARTRFAALLRSIEDAVVELAEQQQQALGLAFGLPPKQIGALVVSLVVGMTVRSVHELDSPPDLFGVALAKLLLP
jgi:AcrR family transcriptional regulator